MPALNVKEYLAASLRIQHKRFVNDLKAIPEDQHNVSSAGCARTPRYMAAECGYVNGWIADFLQTGKSVRLSQEDEDALYASLDTTEKALAYLEENTDKLAAVYESLDENTLGDISDTLFRRPTSKFSAAMLPILHLSYHDGQYNYIQALHGDDKIHW